jgi:hypothetical protein
MRSSHRVSVARLGAILSTLSVVAAVACSDGPTTARRLDAGSAALDKGKGQDGKGQDGKGGDNRGPGNQNDPKDTANKNNQRVKLEARLMTVAGDTTFRGAEGQAEFENRTTEMRFKINVEHIAAGTVVNFFVGTTMIGSATTKAGGEAEFRLESKKGDTIPVVAAGTAVSAQTGAGHVIVSGTF